MLQKAAWSSSEKNPSLCKPSLPSLVFLLNNIERARDVRMPSATKEQEELSLESLPFSQGHERLQQPAVLRGLSTILRKCSS